MEYRESRPREFGQSFCCCAQFPTKSSDTVKINQTSQETSTDLAEAMDSKFVRTEATVKSESPGWIDTRLNRVAAKEVSNVGAMFVSRGRREKGCCEEIFGVRHEPFI